MKFQECYNCISFLILKITIEFPEEFEKATGQFHSNGITFREIFFFNLPSISEHILTENLLIIEILLQVMKLVQF